MGALKSLFLVSCALLFACATGPQPDNMRIVEIYVPGCNWSATAYRVSFALQHVEGVREVKTDTKYNTATVTFDETKTSVQDLTDALKKAKFSVEGEPKYLK